MLRLTLILAAAALLLLFCLASCLSTPSISADQLLRQAPETPTPPQSSEQESTANEEEEDLANKILLVATERYTLIYPAIFEMLIPLDEIIQRIEQAFARVEALLGEFDEHVEIFVPYAITADDLPEGLVIQGVTYVEDGQIKVAVSLLAADIDVFAHELLHARLRDLGIRPPRWIEEGMAHFVETENGFNAGLFQILEEKGVLSLEDAKTKSEEVTSEEMELRATGWAVVYYLVHVKGMSLADIAQTSDLPDTDLALAAVKAAAATRVATSE